MHFKCHCYYENVDWVDVQATSAIEKFTKYIFNEGNDKGKNALFKAWGYSIHDSEELKKEFEKQAQLAYQCGEYELNKKDEHGQKINIVIHLKKKDIGKDISFVSGWMVYPNGKLLLITPFGGRV